MTFLDDESSVEDGEPREFYEFRLGNTYYRMTSSSRDLIVEGLVYTADAIQRGRIKPAQLRGGKDASVEVRLRVNHPLVRRWFQQGVPPRRATAIVKRQQVRSGEVEYLWQGNIASIDAERKEDGSIAVITVTSLLGPAVRRRLPTITAGRECSHALYGTGCGLSSSGSNPDGVAYKCTATVQYVNGREVRFDLSTVAANYTHRADWLQFGRLVHVSSQESMPIMLQTDVSPGVSTVTTVQMQSQIVGLKVGDSIEVYAGCRREIATCYLKFGNQVNYGGQSSMPTKNPNFPTGLGVMEQI